MYLLNLSLAQFLALFGSVSAIAVALYLFDRSRRRLVVSTLRFWVAAEQPSSAARRRRIQQPWSLVLQLLAMALLLLAIAQLRIGTRAATGRDHVLILDVSAWMGARSGDHVLMDLARERARQYIRALPARDRVMLVRADALATPATVFEPDRAKLDAAIQSSRPGATALDLDQALAFARHIQSQQGRVPGEITYIGAGRTAAREPGQEISVEPIRNLRVILTSGSVENCGLRRIGARRSASDGGVWDVYVSAHNYGVQPRTLTLALDFESSGAARADAPPARQITLTPGADGEAGFQLRAVSAGKLTVKLIPGDAFPADDSAQLDLPSQPSLPVTVYSDDPELLRPVLSSNPRVVATYRKPSEYRAEDPGLIVLDRFIPPVRPVSDSLWIDPPPLGSPVPIRAAVENVKVTRWAAGHPVAAGLRTKDFRLDRASILEAAPGDARIAEVEDGPVIVARAGKPKIVVFGFHPALSSMRYELATPLLFANIQRWVSPEIFRRWEIAAGSVGTLQLRMDEDLAPAEITVEAGGAGQSSAPLPFTLRDRTLRFFAGAPGPVRVIAKDHEYAYSLTLPQLWDEVWRPPAGVARGIPRFAPMEAASGDLWPWLALAAAGVMFAEFLLFARFRRTGSAGSRSAPSGAPEKRERRAAASVEVHR